MEHPGVKAESLECREALVHEARDGALPRFGSVRFQTVLTARNRIAPVPISMKEFKFYQMEVLEFV